MRMKAEDHWHCTNPACGCELLVESSAREDGKNPRCSCGGNRVQSGVLAGRLSDRPGIRESDRGAVRWFVLCRAADRHGSHAVILTAASIQEAVRAAALPGRLELIGSRKRLSLLDATRRHERINAAICGCMSVMWIARAFLSSARQGFTREESPGSSAPPELSGDAVRARPQ